MKHVVVGIICRTNSEGKDEYLLVSSKKDFGEYTGAFYPPGGHVEEGEDEQQALSREIEEELGLSVVVGEKLAETSGDVAEQITHWYACELDVGDMKVDTEELAHVGWFTKEQMQALKLWPATRKFFENYIFHENSGV